MVFSSWKGDRRHRPKRFVRDDTCPSTETAPPEGRADRFRWKDWSTVSGRFADVNKDMPGARAATPNPDGIELSRILHE
jgi:hypothetical protein